MIKKQQIEPKNLEIQEIKLKPREVEALNFVREGLLDKEIAEKMGVSEATEKKILRSIYAKLGVHHRTEAVKILHGKNLK